MPRLVRALPTYRHHHASGQAVVTLDGHDYYLGPHGTRTSKQEFDRLIAIKQLVVKSKRPQTLGKVQRFWGTLWRECVESAVFLDLEVARRRIGLFMDHYLTQRPLQGTGQ